jgi:hypothetical protein
MAKSPTHKKKVRIFEESEVHFGQSGSKTDKYVETK